MSRNNTGNPIGSDSSLDFKDNVKNFDEAVNSTAPSWTDRFGANRLTMSGMQNKFDNDQSDRESIFNNFMASSGYEFIGDYAGGIEITAYNQIIRDSSGEFWRLSGTEDLPYTTTGSGLPEGGSFVPVGDAYLRQQLVSDNKSDGAYIIGNNVVHVSSIADLSLIPAESLRRDLIYSVQSYYGDGGKGGGEFISLLGTPFIDRGATVQSSVSGVYFKRINYTTITPEMFGASGDGVTSDADAFVRMANFIKSAGGGCANGAPGQTYLLADTSSVPGALIDLGAIPHFSMDFCGATIKGTNTAAQGNINLFTATNGKNITIKNAVCDFPLLVDEAEDPQGVSLFVGYDKCENVEIGGLSGPGGFNSVLAFERSNTAAYLEYEDQARGINIKNIDLEAVGYGINCRFNGSYLTARSIKLDYCHRGYFPYGVTDHDVELELNDYNATGCRLWGVMGRTLQNIKLKVRVNRIGGPVRNATSIVGFAFASSVASSLKNINVEIDADMNSLHGIGVSFDVEAPTATGRHQLRDIKISAKVRNPTGRVIDSRESNGGLFSSHVFCDLMRIGGHGVNQGSSSVFPNHNSSTRAVVKDLVLTGGSNGFEVLGSGAGSVLFDGCHAASLFSSVRADYVDCIVSTSSGMAPNLCTFKNTTVGSILVNKSMTRHVMPPNENVIQPDLIGARLVSQSASGTLTITLANGTHIYADQLPSVGVAGCVYDFAIGVVGTSASTTGVYTGRVMMKASGGAITAISLIDVNVAHSSGTSLLAEDLTVSLNSGSPVFTLTSSLTNYTQGQVVIRDI